MQLDGGAASTINNSGAGLRRPMCEQNRERVHGNVLIKG